MTVFVNRSIPLSEESRNGWRNAGAVMLPRKLAMRRAINTTEEDVILNLGIGDVLMCEATTWNEHDSIRTVLTPAAIRRTMPDLVPPFPLIGQDAWFKGPGQHGEHKMRMRYEGMNVHGPDDFQLHIEGTEFRVISVGNKVVQAYRKMPPVDGVRNWEWVGVRGVNGNGIIPLVKRAVELVPNGERTVFGWDIILGDRPYIIEANSSPGVGDATAARIIKEITRAV